MQWNEDNRTVPFIPCHVPLRLSPYSHDRDSLSSSQDHIPLAALPLLATSSGIYQHAVGTVIARANQAYAAFLHSGEGTGFCGQVRWNVEGSLALGSSCDPAWRVWGSPSSWVRDLCRLFCSGTVWVAFWDSMPCARAGWALGAAGAAAAVAAW